MDLCAVCYLFFWTKKKLNQIMRFMIQLFSSLSNKFEIERKNKFEMPLNVPFLWNALLDSGILTKLHSVSLANLAIMNTVNDLATTCCELIAVNSNHAWIIAMFTNSNTTIFRYILYCQKTQLFCTYFNQIMNYFGHVTTNLNENVFNSLLYD